MIRSPRKNRSWLFFIAFLPFLVLLWPSLYNVQNPEFMDIPFFYWFQMLLMLTSVGMVSIVCIIAD